MLFEQYFVPDYMMNSFFDLTPEFLMCIGTKAIIAEIDGVLSDDGGLPSERVRKWIEDILACGIRVAVVSNSEVERVRKYCETLPIPAYANAGKPRTRALSAAMRKLGSDPGNTVMLCGRILVDVCAGHRLGITTVAVETEKRKNGLISNVEKFVEKKYINAYQLRRNRGSSDF